MAGWIKLYRCLLEKAVWKNSTPNQRSVLITVLLLANHERNQWEWQGQQFYCEPGQFITSLNSLAKTSKVSIQSVRSALLKLEKLEFLTNESTKTGRLITVINWGIYQSMDDEPNTIPNKEPTKTQQRPNKEPTTNKNDKNDKNDKNNYKLYIVEIVNYLNQKAGTSYKTSSQKTRTLIEARLNDGFIVEDFKTVIDKKCTAWLKDSKMCKYLRPETLFGTKFESYLNEKITRNIPRAYASLMEDDEYDQGRSQEIIDVSDW